jgi:hypothetical protein
MKKSEDFKLLEKVQTVLYNKFNLPMLDTGNMHQVIEYALDNIEDYDWKRKKLTKKE